METQGPAAKPLVQKAIRTNLVIQNALTTQASELEAQLKELDELIEGVNKGMTTEEVPDEAFEREIQIPGSKRANGPIPSFELLSPASPFYRDACQRAHYIRWTSVNPIKGREAEILADAVKKENMRLEAHRARDNPAASPIDIENNIEGINWSIVAEKVSDHGIIDRSPDECRIQWVGKLHPKVNHRDWTQDELNKLHELTALALATGQKVDWARISKELGTNRIPIDCMKQATTRPRHHWDADADQRLLDAVQTFGTNNWNLVARYVSPCATTSQCQTRYIRSVDPSIKREPWTPEEDTRLRKAVEAFSNSWIDVAGVLPGRTNEQCRERWAEIGTNGGGKGRWEEGEDQRLLDAVKRLGKKWKQVSEKIGGGRTGPNCRLRYDRLMKMHVKQAGKLVTSVPGPSTEPTEASVLPPQCPFLPSEPPLNHAAHTGSKPRQRRKAKATAIAETMIDDINSLATIHPRPQTELPGPPHAKPRPRPRPVGTSDGTGREDGHARSDRGIGPEESRPPAPQPHSTHTMSLGDECGGRGLSRPETIHESGVTNSFHTQVVPVPVSSTTLSLVAGPSDVNESLPTCRPTSFTQETELPQMFGTALRDSQVHAQGLEDVSTRRNTGKRQRMEVDNTSSGLEPELVTGLANNVRSTAGQLRSPRRNPKRRRVAPVEIQVEDHGQGDGNATQESEADGDTSEQPTISPVEQGKTNAARGSGGSRQGKMHGHESRRGRGSRGQGVHAVVTETQSPRRSARVAGSSSRS